MGGKFLTNHLKEVISYRHYNMMDETHLINTIKEICCHISLDFASELEKSKHARQGEIKYVLPDYSHSQEGYILGEGEAVREDQQVLALGNERFAIPEVLFTPSDVGTSSIVGRRNLMGCRVTTGRNSRCCYAGCGGGAGGGPVIVTC
jgi:actin-related protein 6